MRRLKNYLKAHIRHRLEKVRTGLKDADIDTLLVQVEENRWYLSEFSGKDGQFDESAGALIINESQQVLATDSRYITQAQQEATGFRVIRYEKGLTTALPDILKEMGTQRLGFESARMSFQQFQRLNTELTKQNANVSLVPVEDLVETIRMVKEPIEIEAIRQSLAISERAFQTILEGLVPGITEKEIAWALEKELRDSGAQGLAFPPIIAAGPNGALPHAIASDKKITEEEPVLFDWGARCDMYCSDISRTIVLGKKDKRYDDIYKIVLDAQAMAIEAIKPGASGQAVDNIARNYIANKGFRDYFGHGLGHGVGLATHEKPSLSPFRPVTLEAGMVITVEPGIYIPGWGGIRLENMILVEANGATILNRLPL